VGPIARKKGWRLSDPEPIPRISVPELARCHTHKAVRLLAQVMSHGVLSRNVVNAQGKRETVWEPASVALRVHCAEVLLERGHGKPAQAMVIAGDVPGSRSLRDLILASMALEDESNGNSGHKTIEHEAADDDEERT
jgi:hypothetical protein